MQVQIISVTNTPRVSKGSDGKPPRNFILQEVQGIVLGEIPQVFKHPFFFFDDAEPHQIVPGHKYECVLDLNVDREAKLNPRVSVFRPLAQQAKAA